MTAGRPEVANFPRGWGDRAGGVVAHDEAHSSRGAGRGPKWQTSGEVGGIGPVAWSLTMAGRAPISPSSARSGKPPARLWGSGRSECHSRRLGRRAAGGARPVVPNLRRGRWDRAGRVATHDGCEGAQLAVSGPKWPTSGEFGGIGPVAWSLTMAGRAPISPSSARSGKPPARLGGSGRSECHSRRLGRRAAGGARPVVPNLRRGRWDRAGHVVAYDGWEGVHPVVRGPKWQTSGEVAGIGPVAWPLATGGKASTPPGAARSGKPPARLLGSGRSAGRSRRWGVRPPCRRLPSMGLHPG